jgi:hypothetical protein
MEGIIIVQWSFFAFNRDKFDEIRQVLYRAALTGDFQSLNLDGVKSTLDSLEDNLSAQTVAGAIIADLCSEGDWLLFSGVLPDLLVKLRRSSDGRDVSDMLSELLTANSGMEEWFLAEEGLIGIFTPEQTVSLAKAFSRIDLPDMIKTPGKVASLFSRRLRTGENPVDLLQDMDDFVQECANSGYGIGVWREN